MTGSKFCLVILLLFCIPERTTAQQTQTTRPSPTALVTVKYKDTYMKITYAQPSKNGRVLFGALVPYGKVWRTGANEATEITATRDFFFHGNLVPAGTYSLFTIPEETQWTVILNRDVGLWGSYNYNAAMDQLRVTVPVHSTSPEVHERFTIRLDQRNNVADLLLLWDQVRISIPIQFIEPKS